MFYDPSNRSYQYMLLQNRAYHARALRNQRSILHDQMRRGPESYLAWQKKNFEEDMKIIEQGPASMTKRGRGKSKKMSKLRTKTEDRFPDLNGNKTMTLSPRRNDVSPHQLHLKTEETKILRENYKLVEKLMTIKPCLPTKAAWRREIAAQEEYKRCMSAFDHGTNRPKTTLDLQHQRYKPKAIEEFLVMTKQESSGAVSRRTGMKGLRSRNGTRISVTPLRFNKSQVFQYEDIGEDGGAGQLGKDDADMRKTPRDILLFEAKANQDKTKLND